MTATASVQSDAYSRTTLAPFQDEIYALQYRLARAVTEAKSASAGILATSSDVVPTAGVRVRRLGVLLRAAHALEQSIAAHAAAHDDAATADGTPSTAVSATHAAPADSARTEYLQHRLPDLFHRLQAEAAAAAQLLEEVRTAESGSGGGLPLSRVGHVPVVLPPQPSAFTDASATDVLVFPAATQSVTTVMPAPTVVTVVSEEKAGLASAPRTSLTAAAPLSNRTASSDADPPRVGAAPVKSAEDQVVDDIKQALQQMKQGALSISEIMNKERPSLEATEALLSSGITRSHENIREIGKMHDVADGEGSSGGAPRLVRMLPGGALLWRTVVAPVWAVIKQALLICFILAITGTTLMVVFTVGKPRRFRAHQRPATLPTTTVLSPQVPTPDNSYHAMHYDPPQQPPHEEQPRHEEHPPQPPQQQQHQEQEQPRHDDQPPQQQQLEQPRHEEHPPQQQQQQPEQPRHEDQPPQQQQLEQPRHEEHPPQQQQHQEQEQPRHEEHLPQQQQHQEQEQPRHEEQQRHEEQSHHEDHPPQQQERQQEGSLADL